MAGYPPEKFIVHGFSITALRAENHFFVTAESDDDNPELNKFILQHIKKSPRIENNSELLMILENAVAEYKHSLKK